jgi:hypothetical protein
MITFDELLPWIESGDVGKVTAALLAAGEPERRALAASLKAFQLVPLPLPTHETPTRERQTHETPTQAELTHETPPQAELTYEEAAQAYFREQAGWQRHRELSSRREGALRVAGAACLTRAADIVSWLRSDRFWEEIAGETIDDLVRVLQAPGRPSLAAVAEGLAAKVRPAQVDRQWPLISRLLATAGLPTPATEATVRGWLREFRFADDARELAGLLRADPRTPALVPQVFAIARVCGELSGQWPPALARLCADGGFDRSTLLASCLLRLRAGDRPGAIKPVVQLHGLLRPTIDEYAGHRQEYLGMLSSPHAPVAELAQRALRAVDEAGRLTVDEAVEAAYAVLLRPEKKLVRAQLGWLAAALGRATDPRLLGAVAAGLGNESVDLAEQALHLAGKHLPACGEAGRRLLGEAAAGLEGDLRRQADLLLAAEQPAGGQPTGEQPTGEQPTPEQPGCEPPAAEQRAGGLGAGGQPPEHAGLLPVGPSGSPEAMPPPIASIAELTGAVTALLHDPAEPVLLERAFAALATFARTDRPALARALRPVVPEYWDSPLVSLLRAAIHGTWTAWEPQEWELRHAAPFWVLVERGNELGRQLCGDPPPALLATPATVDGHVDPARVLTVLTAAEADGWQPGRCDLAQALLRLPREVDPGLLPAAGRLASPAGRGFAAWLRDGGLPDPAVVSCAATHGPGRRGGDQPGVRRTVAFPAVEHPLLTVFAGLLGLPLDDAYERAYGLHREAPMACWPMIAPSHREIIAAHAQPLLAPAAGGSYASQLDILPVLARSAGPFGPAMALCLAYGLAAGRSTGRLAATDAFVLLAGRGVLDGSLVGRELAALYAAGLIVLKRVAGALADAVRAGAAAQVWAVGRELLPTVLATATPGPGAPDLLAAAASAASAAGVQESLPAVSAVAARGGRSRLVTEAARLSRTITR